KGCPLDLHASAFTAPQCAQSLLAKAQMILQCLDSRPTFRIFVRISFAPYVVEWLTDAAAELAASRNIDTARIATRMN
ncbi:MAG: sarcosine oxidase subunit gamma family protein, partial [Betaproteobacteria bacterium]